MATIPLDSVGFRTGAVANQDMLAVLDESATKTNAKSSEFEHNGVGLDLEIMLSVKAWARDAGDDRYSWVDLHVFDDGDTLIRSETLPLKYAGTADDGYLFDFDGSVYRGTGASPGSVWLAPDARKVQYRLYYEVAGTVYSDGLLRQHDLPPDSTLTKSKPPVRRKRAAAAAR